MFNSILEAQTAAVEYVQSRKILEDQLVTYNDNNDPTKALRLAKKEEIKQTQILLNTANVFLNNNFQPSLFYSPLIINGDGNVATPWTDEYKIPGTVLGEIQGISLSKSELDVIKTDTQTFLDNSTAALNNSKDAQTNAESLPDDLASKDLLLDTSSNEINASTQLINTLKDTESILDDGQINKIEETASDVFSADIRNKIQQSLQNKPNYSDNNSIREAAVVLRKKALDAVYTAKNSEEMKVALDRLTRIDESLGSSEPLTFITTTIDENSFRNLTIALNTANELLAASIEELTNAQNALDAAIESEIQVDIDAAQAYYDIVFADYTTKKHDTVILQDQMLGFHDSQTSTSIWPGSTSVQHTTLPVPSKTPPIGTAKDDNERESIAAHAALTPSPPKPIAGVPPNNGVYNNVLADNAIKQKEANDQYNSVISDNLKPKQEAIDNLKDLQKNLKDLQEQDNQLHTSQNDADIESLSLQINEQKQKITQYDANIANATTALQTQTKTLNTSNDAHRAEAAAAILVRDHQANKNADLATGIPTKDEAARNFGDYEQSKFAADQAAQNLNKARKAGEDAAVAEKQRLLDQGFDQEAADIDPQNPSKWPASLNAQKAALTAAQDNLKAKNTDLQDKAAQVAIDAQTPEGQAAQAAAGIKEDQKKAALADIGKTLAKDPNAADATDTTNIRQESGFEGINGGAPFYLQLPTLKSITDFHLRNGINPYGRASAEVARHSVHFNIFEITPPSPRADIVPETGLVRNVIDASKSNTIGSFTIYPSNVMDGFSFRHSHQFTNDSVPDIINTGLEIADRVQDLVTLANAGLESIKQGTEQAIAQKVTRKLESIDHYQKTDRQQITLDFHLFTKDDFLHDIFQPIMFLTSLSYPKRLLDSGLGDQINGAGLNIAQLVGADDETKQQITGFAHGVARNEKKIAELGGIGPYRYFIARRPEYISVRHSSGLFYYPLAVIENVSYEFKGPWYNVGDRQVPATPQQADKETFAEKMKKIGNDFLNAFKNQPAESGNRGEREFLAKAMYDATSENFAYPSMASCSITVKSAVPFFRDDFMALFFAAGKGGDELVHITETQTATQNKFYFNHPNSGFGLADQNNVPAVEKAKQKQLADAAAAKAKADAAKKKT